LHWTEDQVIFNRCYKARFHGYWDDATNMMRSFDRTCDESLQTLVQEPSHPNPTVEEGRMQGQHTADTLYDQLEGMCVLLLGDSTDRQILQNWCPRWIGQEQAVEMWMPDNEGAVSVLSQPVKDKAGWRCAPQQKFTIGNYLQYGVSALPYWKGAHYNLRDYNPNLNWSNTTSERVAKDMPKFFHHCDKVGHNKLKVVVVQSYIWDVLREWEVHQTIRTPAAMIQEWAHNVTILIDQVRQAVPDALVAWRFAGPFNANDGQFVQAIADMNEALAAIQLAEEKVDFVTDYGAVLSSSLASVHNKGPYDVHPPDRPRTAYVNLLLNALVQARKVYVPKPSQTSTSLANDTAAAPLVRRRA
jgi:hypothetical protein